MQKNQDTKSTPVVAPLRQYPAKTNHKIAYPAGQFVNHALPAVQAQALALRSGAAKTSYKEIAVQLGLQCDHFAYLAVHAAGAQAQGWQAVTGGRAAKLARLAAKAAK